MKFQFINLIPQLLPLIKNIFVDIKLEICGIRLLNICTSFLSSLLIGDISVVTTTCDLHDNACNMDCFVRLKKN